MNINSVSSTSSSLMTAKRKVDVQLEDQGLGVLNLKPGIHVLPLIQMRSGLLALYNVGSYNRPKSF
jgi:hypothetical protein